MSKSHRILAALMTLGLTLATFVAGSTQALAQRAPLPDDSAGLPAQPITHSVSNGSPIWVFIVVAALAAALSVAGRARRGQDAPVSGPAHRPRVIVALAARRLAARQTPGNQEPRCPS